MHCVSSSSLSTTSSSLGGSSSLLASISSSLSSSLYLLRVALGASTSEWEVLDCLVASSSTIALTRGWECWDLVAVGESVILTKGWECQCDLLNKLERRGEGSTSRWEGSGPVIAVLKSVSEYKDACAALLLVVFE